VGAVTPEESIDPASVAEGDVVIALASSGLHSNGYSLARRVLLEQAGLSLDATLPGDSMTVGERMLVPTRIYVASIRALVAAGVKPHAMAHITGGGLWENPQRTLPEGFAMAFDTAAVQAMAQPIHASISRLGGVPEREMYRVFNMGIGFLVTVSPSEVDATLDLLRAQGERAEVVGGIVARTGGGVELNGLSDAPLV
jgi:phosphoribosylformylglycinamidine cyclo-ligase